MHEWKEVEADIYTCPSCYQELLKAPERGYCPTCSYYEMVVVKGTYKELVEINNNTT